MLWRVFADIDAGAQFIMYSMLVWTMHAPQKIGFVKYFCLFFQHLIQVSCLVWKCPETFINSEPYIVHPHSTSTITERKKSGTFLINEYSLLVSNCPWSESHTSLTSQFFDYFSNSASTLWNVKKCKIHLKKGLQNEHT